LGGGVDPRGGCSRQLEMQNGIQKKKHDGSKTGLAYAQEDGKLARKKNSIAAEIGG